MAVDGQQWFNQIAAIKSEVVNETFSFSEVIKDFENRELKAEPVDFEEHELEHLDQESFSCVCCQFTCKEKDELVQHMEMHVTTKREYFCRECNFKTIWKCSLKSHSKIHKGEQYACNQCNFKTFWKSSLNQHLEIHKGIYFCNECDFKAMSKYTLRTHCKIHKCEQYAYNRCNFKTN
ncbi:hypothetical protein FQA39_LY03623 [Lamprigera yunnana]|nr:hypothetical protein FQA39_LY03623 [Lamprigera yunnana]